MTAMELQEGSKAARGIQHELSRLAPDDATLATGHRLIANPERRFFRWVGERSYSFFVGLSLGGPDARGVWDWLSDPDRLCQIERQLIAECECNPRADAGQRQRVRRWARGNRSLLDPTKPTRWGLLQALAAQLHAHATTQYPDASAEEGYRRRLSACWAWYMHLGVLARQLQRDAHVTDRAACVSRRPQGRALRGKRVWQIVGVPESARRHGQDCTAICEAPDELREPFRLNCLLPGDIGGLRPTSRGSRIPQPPPVCVPPLDARTHMIRTAPLIESKLTGCWSCLVLPGMHWMTDSGARALYASGVAGTKARCPLCRGTIEFARKAQRLSEP